jgi:hypothetical protein
MRALINISLMASILIRLYLYLNKALKHNRIEEVQTRKLKIVLTKMCLLLFDTSLP